MNSTRRIIGSTVDIELLDGRIVAGTVTGWVNSKLLPCNKRNAEHAIVDIGDNPIDWQERGGRGTTEFVETIILV